LHTGNLVFGSRKNRTYSASHRRVSATGGKAINKSQQNSTAETHACDRNSARIAIKAQERILLINAADLIAVRVRNDCVRHCNSSLQFAAFSDVLLFDGHPELSIAPVEPMPNT
jgi:hypothetical protein